MRVNRNLIIRALVHIAGWLPLAWIIIQAFTNGLSVNPIQDVLQRFGRFALYFLVASLSCTPIKILLGWTEPVKHRRALGLYAFMYAALHFSVFFAVDYAFNIKQALQFIAQKPFVIFGAVGFLILLSMAVTSNRYMMKILGKGWKKLHRLVYLAGIFTSLHYALAVKGNFITLGGNIILPVILGLVVVLGLIVRLPLMRKWYEKRHREIQSAS